MSRFTIITQSDRFKLVSAVTTHDLPFTASLAKGVSRSLSQNALIHKWFGEIAKQQNEGADEVKADCNLRFGRPILLRDDPEWAEMFEAIIRPLAYARAREVVRVLDLPFTRRMTVKQLTEYMETMSGAYRSHGIILTDPEARKYEAEFA